ncbi:hypothetical protein [Curtobacterium sp. SAFR-003]|uniref:hypothetical protein n=1 Tax=Curtobacterium sp. SAFR-003 TaxID=3387276 RepID=UPI003F7DC10A
MIDDDVHRVEHGQRDRQENRSGARVVLDDRTVQDEPSVDGPCGGDVERRIVELVEGTQWHDVILAVPGLVVLRMRVE